MLGEMYAKSDLISTRRFVSPLEEVVPDFAYRSAGDG
jgi:hypothetical protein